MRPRTAARVGLPLRALRVAACLLLAAIGGDLLADTQCDEPPSFSGAPTAVREERRTQGTTDERCDAVCPDCFCCARSVVAGPAVVQPEPGLALSLEAPGTERWPEGVRSVVDHPPLARA